MFFHEKLCRILREKNRSDGIWRFWRADDQFPILPRDAFVDGQPAGHFYTKDGLDVNNPSFLMHLTMYSTMTQKVDFYVVANEAAMETPGSSVLLTENTTETQLNHFTFTKLNTSCLLYTSDAADD